MSTHNIRFYGEIAKVILELSPYTQSVLLHFWKCLRFVSLVLKFFMLELLTFSGFPQALENMEMAEKNSMHGKIMEFENKWKTMKKSWVLAWDGFLDISITQIFSRLLCSLEHLKRKFVILEQSTPKTSLLHHKTKVFILIKIIWSTYFFLPSI